MKKLPTIIIIFYCFATLTSMAQLTDWLNLANKDFVSRIIHDENYLYVGTFGGGIVKMDKQTCEQTVLCRANLGTTDNKIMDMAIHDGELWVGTGYYGLAKISGGNIEKFDMRNSGLFNNQFIGGLYFGSDGGMLFGGMAALYQFDGKQVTASFDINPISSYDYVTSIKADPIGRIWVGCYDAMNSVTLGMFTPEGLVNVRHPYGNVNRLEIGADSCLWMATDNGLVRYDGNEFTAYTPDNSGLPEFQVNDLMADHQGNLWMVSNNYLMKFDGSHFETHPYQRDSNKDMLICIDVDGDNVYVGSRTRGLFRLTDDGLENIPLVDNQHIDTSFLYFTGCLDRDGVFYGATLDGLQTYNMDTGDAHLTPMQQIAQMEVDRDGDIWIGWHHFYSSDTCLMEITPAVANVYHQYDYPFSDFDINLIKFDHHNRLWLATTAGLYRRDDSSQPGRRESWKVYIIKDISGLSYGVRCLAFDDNDRIWCGTYGGGLFLFDGSKWTQYTTANSNIPSDYVGSVAIDNDNVVWLNCRYQNHFDDHGLPLGFGLTRFDGTSWHTYRRANSPIPSDFLYDIKIDADNNKWLATAGDIGLVSFDGTDWRTYNVDNSGIACNEVTRITIDAKRDLIWLTHANGYGLSVALMNSHNTAESIIPSNAAIPTAIYDINGRALQYAPAKGIYIQEGKKHLK